MNSGNPMSVPQARLLAYVDGELDANAAAEVEAALARDPEAQAFVQRERLLRRRLQAAFAPVLDEPVPERLSALLAETAAAPTVVDLQAERERRRPPPPAPAAPAPRTAWPMWMGLAASVLLSVGVGFALGQRSGAGAGEMLASADGALVAGAPLASALATQTSAEAKGAVRVGMSFVSTDGHYCRSFTLNAQATAGLACEQGGRWQVQMLARDEAPADNGDSTYRQAASPWPQALLEAIDRRIAGAPLDARGEAEAIRRGWKR
jgi:negative regulator of sigma E activity